MTKRITTMLVSVLAVVSTLWAAPAVGPAVKQAPTGARMVKMTRRPAVNRPPVSPTGKPITAGRAFTSPVTLPVPESHPVAVKVPYRPDRNAVSHLWRARAMADAAMRRGAPRHAGETVDDNGIITSPGEGVRKVYNRGGMTYKNTVEDGLQQVEQSGQIHLVECADGTVYIRNIVSSLGTGAWVKGTREGNTITVPTRQHVLFKYEETASIYWGVNDVGFSAYEDYADAFTFTVNDEARTITLDGTDENLFLGVFWDNDHGFAFAGDYESVWTYSHDYEPLDVVAVTPPAGLATEVWYSKGHLLVDEELSLVKGSVNIGFAGDEVYVQGIFADFPEAWLKGRVDGDRVTFDGLQPLGTLGANTVYAVGCDGSDLQSFTMTYDADARALTADNILLANADGQDINHLAWFNDLTLQADDPFAPVDVPYANGFDSRDEWDAFTVIDANADGRYWRNIDEAARYHYSSENDADDWLISPLINLVPGKVYRLAFDTKCQGYIERLEVFMGASQDVDAMTRVIFPEFEVANDDYETLDDGTITVDEAGYYCFGFHCVSAADQNVLYIDNFVLEEVNVDAPAAVTDLAVAGDADAMRATVSFTLPTLNLGGTALEGPLTVDVYRDGEVINTVEDAAPGDGISFVDEGLAMGSHTYWVVVSNAAGAGAKSGEVKIMLIGAVDVPYVADFTLETTFDVFSAIDANEDGTTWLWNDSSHAFYSYNSNNAADDYLVSPPVRLEAGKSYDVTVNAGAMGYPEQFEVVIGREATAEGLGTVILPAVTVQDEDDVAFTCSFDAEESGEYYVAVHCVSAADLYELWIHRLAIEPGAEPASPAAPQFTLAAGANGALSAVLSVTAPATSVDGNALTAPIDRIDIYRDGEQVGQLEDVTPGAQVTYVDEVESSGVYAYTLQAVNAAGQGKRSETLSAYIGIDAPQELTDVTALDRLSSVLFSWNKVGTEGVKGGYVDPSGVTYRIFGTHNDEWWGLMFDDEPLAQVVDDDHYELPCVTDEGEQTYGVWGVSAANEAGETSITEVSLLLGKPYDLPVVEGFEGGAIHYLWETNATVLTSTDATDEDGSAVALTALYPDTEIYLTSGKLNVNDAADPVLLLDVQGHGMEQITIIGNRGDGQVEVLATPAVSAAYRAVEVPLSSLKGGPYAMIGILANIATPTEIDEETDAVTPGDAIVLDNIRIIDRRDFDLKAEVSAPATVTAGRTAVITAMVTNQGVAEAMDYTVTVRAGDRVLYEETADDELASFQTRRIAVNFDTSVIDEPGDVTVTVSVDFDSDELPGNNTATTVITVVEPNITGPENLMADVVDDGVSLSWTAPADPVIEVTEPFDDTSVFPPFDLGGIDASRHNGELGDWTLYDGNGTEVYSWQSDEVSYPDPYSPSAWRVFDPARAGLTPDLFGAHSGDQFLLSMCPYEEGNVPSADHWLISPQLNGKAQTISFFARVITANYGMESFEVLASSTDNNPESFTPVKYVDFDNTTWTEFKANLPAGTRYFAVRHTSQDIFGMMVDDFTYAIAGDEVVAYNIYVDGVQVGTVTGETVTYTVDLSAIEDGLHEFAVTAVYGNGIESSPARARATTAIERVLADGKPADIFTIDGKLLRRGATSLEGIAPGFYVVGGKVVMVK